MTVYRLPDDLGHLADRIVRDASGRRPVVMIDGGSGSGKTTLAHTLADAVAPRLGPVQVVSLDSVYPGWHGLDAASRAVHETILRAEDPGYQGWDWNREAPSEWHQIDGRLPLIVEGCGALTPASAALASTRLWLQMDAVRRKTRALDRDGDDFRPWWDAWAAQEHRHWRRDKPRSLADAIVVPPPGD